MAYLHYQDRLLMGDVYYISYMPDCEDINWVELQADGGNIRYTMDGKTWPTLMGYGMVLLETKPPKRFHIEDFRNLRFCVDGKFSRLLMHFGGGRDVVEGLGAFEVWIGTYVIP